jgi:hypothetical protein
MSRGTTGPGGAELLENTKGDEQMILAYIDRLMLLMAAAPGMVMVCPNTTDPRTSTAYDAQTLDGRVWPTAVGAVVRTTNGLKAWRRNSLAKWVPIHSEIIAVGAETRAQKLDSTSLRIEDLDRPVDLVFEGVIAKDALTVAGLRLRVNGDEAFGVYGNLTTELEVAIQGELRIEARRFGQSDATRGMNASLTHDLALIDSGEVVAGGYLPFRLAVTVDPGSFDHDDKEFWLVSWSMVYARDATASAGWPLCQVDGKFYVRAPSGGVVDTIGIEAGVVDLSGPTFIPGGMMDGARGTKLTISYR